MIEITDEMVEAYMDYLSPGWRSASSYRQGRFRASVREDLEHAAAVLAPALAAAEREECARIADAVQDDHKCHVVARQWAGTIAWNIRARGDKP